MNWRFLASVVTRFYKPGLVAVAAVLGVYAPTPGTMLSPLTTPIVVYLVYGSLRETLTGERVFPSMKLVGVSLAISYLALPIIVAATGSTFLSEPATMGSLIAATAPATAGSAIVWTRFGWGDEELVAIVVLSSIALTPLMTPVVLGAMSSPTVSFNGLGLLRELLVILGGAIALTGIASRWSSGYQSHHFGSQVAILLLVYISVASRNLIAVPMGLLVEMTGMVLVVTATLLILVGFLGVRAWATQPQRTAVFFGSGLKNLGVALLVAKSLGVGGSTIIAITLFYIVQQLTSGVAAEIFRTRHPAR